MIDKPTISIITPSFNQGQYIEENMLSIAAQDYPHVEHLIIDGGSTDNTVDVIKKHEDKLTYWVSEPDRGQAHAIIKGMERSKGHILTWINSDDLLLPNVLGKVVQYFQDNDVALIHGKTILFGDNMTDIVRGAEPQDLRCRYLAGMPFHQPSSFFTREALEAVGGLKEEYRYAMDYDLFARMALRFEFLHVEGVYSKYRLHEESKSIAETAHFPKEWAAIFSRVLRSFDHTQELIDMLKALDLYGEDNDTYPVEKAFTFDELRMALLYFLDFMVQFYYKGLDLKTTKRITGFLKKYDPAFYEQRGLAKVHLRANILPAGMIGWLRGFTH